MSVVHSDFEKMISIENILQAWQVFKVGKTTKPDVEIFERNLEDNLFALAFELKNGTYKHSGYKHFVVSDPKKRDINKAEVRDRIVHQILYDYLVELFEPNFIEHSYSSRIGKGTLKAVLQLKKFSEEIAKNNYGNCYAYKCDVRKYFDNINHLILFDILCIKIKDERVRKMLLEVINSFNIVSGKGIPLGNVTSQIFANIYLNELDQYVLKTLKICYYIRYNDDFIMLGLDRKQVCDEAEKAKKFVVQRLSLEIPKEKAVFRKLKWGIDFCGSVILPDAILLRHKTKKGMLKKLAYATLKFNNGDISLSDFTRTYNSYVGLMQHYNCYNLKNKIKNEFLYGAIF